MTFDRKQRISVRKIILHNFQKQINKIFYNFRNIYYFRTQKFCRNLNEKKDAILEYKKTLTPEKCARFISHMRKV